MNAGVKNITFSEKQMFVQFVNGQEIVIGLDHYPRLLKGSDDERKNYELWNDGKWIHWEILDEDLSAEGLLKHAIEPSVKL